jgi:RecA-family ATPase
MAYADNIRPLRPEPKVQFETINPASWDGKEVPRREWMVEGAIVKGSVCLIAGDGGIGKSLAMQQLCTCAALGRPWLGLSCQPGRALFFGCEDDRDELWRRQYDICRSLGRTLGDVGEAGLELAPRVGFDNTLSRLDRKEWKMVVTDLFLRLAEKCQQMGINYVVIDTATQTFGGNQNDEQQVVQFCNQLRRLAVAIQGCVIITKHPSVAGRALGTGESGSVSWNNSVRSRMYLHRDKEDRTILKTMKNNYGRIGETIPLRWERGCFLRDEPEAQSGSWGYRD